MKSNLIILFSVLLFSISINAQETTQKDSIIVLREIKILKKKKAKKHITKIDLDGRPNFGGLNQISKIVSVVKNIPEGRLSYVDFYFNCGLVNFLKKKLDINYKDTELGLLVYEVAQDGKPGKAISENEIKFIVKKEHNGRFRIDLSTLNLYHRNIYMGVQVLSKLDDKEKNIYVRFSENENASTYIVSENYKSANWHKYYSPKAHFKLSLGVEDYL